jgi:tetratricopeptide (TPR) repeat protein
LLFGLSALAALGAPAIAWADPPITSASTPSADAPTPPASIPPAPMPPTPPAAVAKPAEPVKIGETAPALLPPGPAAAPPAGGTDRHPRTRQAKALHDEAWTLYAEGRYRAAIERLEAALRIDPEGRELVYNLALIHEKLGDLKEAIAYYGRYLQMEPDPRTRARIGGVLRRLEGAEREVVAAPYAPGALAGPRAPAQGAAPPLRPVRPWVIATGSVAGAALLTGVICGFSALAKNPGPNPRTGDGVTYDDIQIAARAAHTDAVAADVSFLVAAVAAGTATLLYFSTPRGAPPGVLAALAGRAQVSF